MGVESPLPEGAGTKSPEPEAVEFPVPQGAGTKSPEPEAEGKGKRKGTGGEKAASGH